MGHDPPPVALKKRSPQRQRRRKPLPQRQTVAFAIKQETVSPAHSQSPHSQGVPARFAHRPRATSSHGTSLDRCPHPNFTSYGCLRHAGRQYKIGITRTDRPEKESVKDQEGLSTQQTDLGVNGTVRSAQRRPTRAALFGIAYRVHRGLLLCCV